MELKEFFIYLIIMSGSTYLIRVIPFLLVNKKIENRFVNSFLYYIPYTVLAAMTFPAVLYTTGHIASAIIGLVVAILVAIKNKNLTIVAIAACLAVLVSELFILYI